MMERLKVSLGQEMWNAGTEDLSHPSYCMHYMVLHVAEHLFHISTVPIGVHGQEMMSLARDHLSTIILTWQEKDNGDDIAITYVDSKMKL